MTPAENTHQRTVLCIDDELSNLALRKILLESSGYNTLTAASGADGLKLFQSAPIDAVILDYSMAEMDGGAVSLHMRRLQPRVPIVMLSGFPGAMLDAEHAADALISKADDPKKLLYRLGSLIRARDHAHPELEREYVVHTNASMQFVDCSDSICGLTGYSRSEFLEKTIPDLDYAPDDVSEDWRKFRAAGSWTGEYIIRHKNGRPIPISVAAWVFADQCTAAVWEPITDWKELYRRAILELNSAKLRQYIEVAVIAIHRRLRELSAGPASAEERHELDDALAGIRVLQSDLK